MPNIYESLRRGEDYRKNVSYVRSLYSVSYEDDKKLNEASNLAALYKFMANVPVFLLSFYVLKFKRLRNYKILVLANFFIYNILGHLTLRAAVWNYTYPDVEDIIHKYLKNTL